VAPTIFISLFIATMTDLSGWVLTPLIVGWLLYRLWNFCQWVTA